MEKISIATQLKDIWIPPSGRPYWTTVNSRGNTGSHLTDKELEDRKDNLSIISDKLSSDILENILKNQSIQNIVDNGLKRNVQEKVGQPFINRQVNFIIKKGGFVFRPFLNGNSNQQETLFRTFRFRNVNSKYRSMFKT